MKDGANDDHDGGCEDSRGVTVTRTGIAKVSADWERGNPDTRRRGMPISVRPTRRVTTTEHTVHTDTV